MNPWRIIGWSFAGALLLLPAIAMQFTREVNWGIEDFAFAAAMLGGVGALFEVGVRRSRNLTFRLAVASALLIGFATIWINAAVGIIGGDNPYNLAFAGVVAATLLAAVAFRGQAGALALISVAAAGAQALVAIGGMQADWHGGLIGTVMAAAWLIPAALFARAGREVASVAG